MKKLTSIHFWSSGIIMSLLLLPGCAANPDQYTNTNFDPVAVANQKAEERRLAGEAAKITEGAIVVDSTSAPANPVLTPKPTKLMTNPTDTAVHETQVTLHTEQGDIVIALSDQTPKTSQNFVDLAKKHFYDGTIFHRVIKGFMIQGGDPKGDGTGGPGYQFDDEPFTGSYTRGTVAMANAGPNTNGSQFFIMHADYPLSHDYIIFGHVVKGIEVVDKIATAAVSAGRSGEGSTPVTPVKVKSVTVSEGKKK